jgi:hypothetical protein
VLVIFDVLLILDPETRFMVTLGWIIGRPLALLFDPFESVVSDVPIISPIVTKHISRFSTFQVCFELSMKYATSSDYFLMQCRP